MYIDLMKQLSCPEFKKKKQKKMKISMTQKFLKAFFLMAMEIKQTNTLDFDNIRTKQSQGKMHCPRYLMINWV